MTRNQCNLSGRIKQSWVWIIVWILKKKTQKNLEGKVHGKSTDTAAVAAGTHN